MVPRQSCFFLAVWVSCLLAGVEVNGVANAHEGGGDHHRGRPPGMQERIRRLNTSPSASKHSAVRLVAQRDTDSPDKKKSPTIAEVFGLFPESVRVRWDRDFLYVESQGMPEHPMMTGIIAWQQQVPLPQDYTGSNAWRIPLRPVPARKPKSAKSGFFRGAIAIAVNGVPIFNPLKNDGKTDTWLAGELDQWGGHCGRADDYHYHVAPIHLQLIVGKDNPIAFALDGYPIYGLDETNGSGPKLDQWNGHVGPSGDYHYHASRSYPYINGGFYGQISERNGQVDPQPRTQPVRPAMSPLPDARVTGFSRRDKPGSFRVLYQVDGQDHQVNYSIASDRSVTFQYVSPSGTKTETYRPRSVPRSDERPRRGPPSRPSGDR